MHQSSFILLGLLIFSVFTTANGAYKNQDSKAAKMIEQGKTYHQDVSLIRKMHPDFLAHKRDQTLRQGIRSEQSSLKACIHCHANKNKETAQYFPVDASGQFCADCHQQVSVSMDCFTCHRNTPDIKRVTDGK